MNLPGEYLIMRQPAGQPARIFYVKGTVETVIFEGARWPARWKMGELSQDTAYRGLRRFNQRRGRGGHAGTIEELTDRTDQ